MGQAWQLASIGHALLNQPGDLFQANIWWPLENSLASTDILFGYAPMTLIGSGRVAALVHYNLLFLFAYALAFVGRTCSLGNLASDPQVQRSPGRRSRTRPGNSRMEFGNKFTGRKHLTVGSVAVRIYRQREKSSPAPAPLQSVRG
jgi:hypothetical protein